MAKPSTGRMNLDDSTMDVSEEGFNKGNDENTDKFGTASISGSVACRKSSKKKLKIKRAGKVRGNLSRSRLTSLRNTSLNSTMVKQSLKANNRALARALESVRAELNLLTQQNLELQEIQQGLMVRNTALERVAGLKDSKIDKEVEERVKKRMVEVKGVLSQASVKMNGVSSQMLSTVELLGEAMSMCSGLVNRMSTSSSCSSISPAVTPGVSPAVNSLFRPNYKGPRIATRVSKDEVIPSVDGVQANVSKAARVLASGAASIKHVQDKVDQPLSIAERPPVCDMSMILEQSYFLDDNNLGPLPFTDDDHLDARLSAISEKSERISRSKSGGRRSTGPDRKSRRSCHLSPDRLRKSAAGMTPEVPSMQTRRSLRTSSRRRTFVTGNDDESADQPKPLSVEAKDTHIVNTNKESASKIESSTNDKHTNADIAPSEGIEKIESSTNDKHTNTYIAPSEGIKTIDAEHFIDEVNTEQASTAQQMYNTMNEETVQFTYTAPTQQKQSKDLVKVKATVVDEEQDQMDEETMVFPYTEPVVVEREQTSEPAKLGAEVMEPAQDPMDEETMLYTYIEPIKQNKNNGSSKLETTDPGKNIVSNVTSPQFTNLHVKQNKFDDDDDDKDDDDEDDDAKEAVEHGDGTGKIHSSSMSSDESCDLNSSPAHEVPDLGTGDGRQTLLSEAKQEPKVQRVNFTGGEETTPTEKPKANNFDTANDNNGSGHQRGRSVTRQNVSGKKPSLEMGNSKKDSIAVENTERHRSPSIERRGRSPSIQRRGRSPSIQRRGRSRSSVPRHVEDISSSPQHKTRSRSKSVVRQTEIVKRTRSRSCSTNRRQTFVRNSCADLDDKLAEMLKKAESGDEENSETKNDKVEGTASEDPLTSVKDAHGDPLVEHKSRGRSLSRRGTFVKAVVTDNEDSNDAVPARRGCPINSQALKSDSENEDPRKGERRGRSVTRRDFSSKQMEGSTEKKSATEPSGTGDSEPQKVRPRSPSIARRGRSRSSFQQDADGTAEVRTTRSRSRSAVRQSSSSGAPLRSRSSTRRSSFQQDADGKVEVRTTRSRSRSAVRQSSGAPLRSRSSTRRETFVTKPEDVDAKLAEMLRKVEGSPEAEKLDKPPCRSENDTCDSVQNDGVESNKQEIAKKPYVSKLPTPNFKRTGLPGKSKTKPYPPVPKHLGSSPEPKGSRRDTYAVVPAAAVESKSDRRGTFVLPRKDVSTTAAVKDISKERRGTYFVQKPTNDHLEVENLLEQEDDILLNASDDSPDADPSSSPLPSMTKPVQPAGETKSSVESLPLPKPVGEAISSIPPPPFPKFVDQAKSSMLPPALPTEETICVEIDMELTEVVGAGNLQTMLNQEPQKLMPPPFITKETAKEPQFLRNIDDQTCVKSVSQTESKQNAEILPQSSESVKMVSGETCKLLNDDRQVSSEQMFSESVKMIKKKRTKSQTQVLNDSMSDGSSLSAAEERDLQDVLTDSETVPNKFTAWMSQPGKITFTAGRKDIMDITMPAKKARSKGKATLPVKPRSKVKPSKKTKPEPQGKSPRVPKSVFDFGKAKQGKADVAIKSVFDMSLSDSLCVEKPTFGQYIGRQPLLEKPKQIEETQEGKIDKTKSPKKKNHSKARLAEKYHPKVLSTTDSPHGIMLVLGDGKRTKPRSKMSKQVCIATVGDADITMRETHFISPSKTPGGPKVPKSATATALIKPPTPPKFSRHKLAPDTPPDKPATPPNANDLHNAGAVVEDECTVPESPGIPVSGQDLPPTGTTSKPSEINRASVKTVTEKRRSRISQVCDFFSSEEDVFTSTDDGLDPEWTASTSSKPRRKKMENQCGEVDVQKKKRKKKDVGAKETVKKGVTLDSLRKKLDALRNRESLVTHLSTKPGIPQLDSDNPKEIERPQASEPSQVRKVTSKPSVVEVGTSSEDDSEQVQHSKSNGHEQYNINVGGKSNECKDTRECGPREDKHLQVDSEEESTAVRHGKKNKKSSRTLQRHKGRTDRPGAEVCSDDLLTRIKTEVVSDVEYEADEDHQRAASSHQASIQHTAQEGISSQQSSPTNRTSSKRRPTEESNLGVCHEVPSKRPRRGTSSVSYKELSIGAKMRQGDPGSSTIYSGSELPDLSKKSKKSHSKAKDKDKNLGRKRSALSTITNDSTAFIKQEV